MEIVAVTIAGHNVYWYGLVLSLALAVTCLAVRCIAGYYREEFGVYLDTMLLALPLGLVLARLFYVVCHWQLYQQDLTTLLNLAAGGVSIYGAFVGFLLAAWLVAARQRYPLGRLLDLFTPAAISGLIVVQLGNFALQSVVGRPTEYFKLVEYIEFAFRPSGFEGYEYFMPVALYQAVWLCIVLVAALLGHRKRRCYGFDGSLTLYSLMLILLGRFGLGFLYLSPQGWCVHLTSLSWLAVTVVFWLWHRRRVGWRAGKYTLRL